MLEATCGLRAWLWNAVGKFSDVAVPAARSCRAKAGPTELPWCALGPQMKQSGLWREPAWQVGELMHIEIHNSWQVLAQTHDQSGINNATPKILGWTVWTIGIR